MGVMTGFIWLRIEIDGGCEYLEWLTDCWFLKDSAPWRWCDILFIINLDISWIYFLSLSDLNFRPEMMAALLPDICL
jgi:hypothetical protein